MSQPQFNNLPPYNYCGAQINLIQYCDSYENGSLALPDGYNERFIYSFTAPNNNAVQFEDSVDITASDFTVAPIGDINSTFLLARNMVNSIGKTLAVFTSHMVTDPINPAQFRGVSIDSSVGQFQNGNELVNVQTFGAGVRAAVGFSILTVTSYLNNLRT